MVLLFRHDVLRLFGMDGCTVQRERHFCLIHAQIDAASGPALPEMMLARLSASVTGLSQKCFCGICGAIVPGRKRRRSTSQAALLLTP